MDRFKLDNYQPLPGSALTVDSTATDGSALAYALNPLGSALAETISQASTPACGSALTEVNTADISTYGSALTSTDNEAGMTDSQTDMAAIKRIPGVTEPYKHVGTREKLESALVWFMAYPTRAQLSRLHLCAGARCSDLAKKRGIFHGLCDERGMKAEPKVATHVGFTAGDEEEMED